MSDLIAKLNKALKPGNRPSPSGTLTHDNEAEILEVATNLLSQSGTGVELLDFARERGIKMHVLRNKQDFGVMPPDSAGESVVYISCPAGQRMPPARAVIHLAGALRQAMQETLEPLKRPASPHMPQDAWVRNYVSRDKDVLYHQTAVVYELSKVNGLSEILDEFAQMGYLSLYEAYKEDIKSQQG